MSFFNFKYNKYHAQAFGLIALIAHPIFWFWWSYIDPSPYESISLRSIGFFSAVILLIVSFNEEKFETLKVPVWICVVTYNLPFFFIANLINNRFLDTWLMSQIVMIFVVILFMQRFALSMIILFFGLSAALLFCYLTQNYEELYPIDLFTSHIIIYLLAIVSGFIFNLSNVKGIIAQEKTNMQSLAGSIAHEIRNPLGQIKYSLDTLAEDIAILDPNNVGRIEIENKSLDDLYGHIDNGQNSIKRGLQVISMILDEVKGKPIDSNQFLYLSAQKITQKAIDEYVFENIKNQRKINTNLEQDFVFKIDETFYIFILFNLIKNALYYVKSHKSSQIYIRTEKGKNRNYVFVKDTGPGISTANLKKLFDSFFTYGKKGGTGLGLHYCHRVMKAFGGSISCDSVEGEFTEFKLAFPIPTESEMKAHKDAVIESAKSVLLNKKILLVDDEPTNRIIARQQLKPFTINIDEADSGKKAIEKVKNNTYDFILMDINMPNMNGYEAAKKIREFQTEQSKPLIPIFAYSSEPRQIAQIKAADSGMCMLIEKSCSQLEFIQAIQPELEKQTVLLHNAKDFSENIILIADDNEVNLQILQAYLRKFKIKKILKATHGTAVLDLLKTEKCDLILMDIQMPVMDGFETTRQLRLQDNFKSIPIIAISGEDSDQSKAEASSSGINDYMVKPITSDALKQVLTTWL